MSISRPREHRAPHIIPPDRTLYLFLCMYYELCTARVQIIANRRVTVSFLLRLSRVRRVPATNVCICRRAATIGSGMPNEYNLQTHTHIHTQDKQKLVKWDVMERKSRSWPAWPFLLLLYTFSCFLLFLFPRRYRYIHREPRVCIPSCSPLFVPVRLFLFRFAKTFSDDRPGRQEKRGSLTRLRAGRLVHPKPRRLCLCLCVSDFFSLNAWNKKWPFVFNSWEGNHPLNKYISTVVP